MSEGEQLRLAFMGSPDFAVPALEALARSGHEIACVYTQPPRPAGRGQRARTSPVQARAEELDLPVRTPASLKDADTQEAFTALQADAAVVAAYGQILPSAVLAAPRLGCLNIHASLLPRWRGPAPIARAIMAGDSETGVTIMQMVPTLDAGPILLQQPLPLDATTKAGEVHDRLADMGARLILPALNGLADGSLTPEAQDNAAVTYAPKLGSGELAIAWDRPAEVVDRQIRALSPAPGASTRIAGYRLKVLEAEPIALNHDAAPGTTLDGRLTVACGDGALRLTRVQRAGRAVMAAEDLLRGFAVPAGTQLA